MESVEWYRAAPSRLGKGMFFGAACKWCCQDRNPPGNSLSGGPETYPRRWLAEEI